MTIGIPGWLQWVSYLAGEKWPQGDEDAMWRIADTWRTHADQLRDLIPDLDSVTQETLSVIEGASAQAIADEFTKMFSGDYAVDKLAEGMDGLGDLASATGTQIQYTKLNILASLGIAAIQIAIALANAWETFGGSLAGIPIIEAITRAAIAVMERTLLKEIVEKIGETVAATTIKKLIETTVGRIAFETLKWTALGAAQELGIQGYQISQGHRSGIDVRQLGSVVESYALGGAIGGASSVGMSKFADRAFGQVTESTSKGAILARGGVIGYVSGAAGNSGAMLLTGGHFNAAGFFGSSLMGALPGKSEGAGLAADGAGRETITGTVGGSPTPGAVDGLGEHGTAGHPDGAITDATTAEATAGQGAPVVADTSHPGGGDTSAGPTAPQANTHVDGSSSPADGVAGSADLSHDGAGSVGLQPEPSVAAATGGVPVGGAHPESVSPSTTADAPATTAATAAGPSAAASAPGSPVAAAGHSAAPTAGAGSSTGAATTAAAGSRPTVSAIAEHPAASGASVTARPEGAGTPRTLTAATAVRAEAAAPAGGAERIGAERGVTARATVATADATRSAGPDGVSRPAADAGSSGRSTGGSEGESGERGGPPPAQRPTTDASRSGDSARTAEPARATDSSPAGREGGSTRPTDGDAHTRESATHQHGGGDEPRRFTAHDRGDEQTGGRHGREPADPEVSHVPDSAADVASAEAARVVTARFGDLPVRMEIVAVDGLPHDAAHLPHLIDRDVTGHISSEPPAESSRPVRTEGDGDGDVVPDRDPDDAAQPPTSHDGGRTEKTEELATARRVADDAATQRMERESREAPARVLKSFDDAAQKVMSSMTTRAEGLPAGVGGDVHPAPDAVTMLAVSGSLLGAVSVKAAFHGAARLTDAVRARLGGARTEHPAVAHDPEPNAPEGIRPEGIDDAAEVGVIDAASGVSDRVALSSSMTREEADRALGVLDQSNVSGQQCGDQAIAVRDGLLSGEAVAPENRGSDFAGLSTSELADRLGVDGFDRASVDSVAGSLHGLGEHASATVVGRTEAGGDLHAVTVARLDGEHVVLDPSAPAGERVMSLADGLGHFTEFGAAYHDGRGPVGIEDARLTHPRAELGGRKVFGDHELVGTRRGGPRQREFRDERTEHDERYEQDDGERSGTRRAGDDGGGSGTRRAPADEADADLNGHAGRSRERDDAGVPLSSGRLARDGESDVPTERVDGDRPAENARGGGVDGPHRDTGQPRDGEHDPVPDQPDPTDAPGRGKTDPREPINGLEHSGKSVVDKVADRRYLEKYYHRTHHDGRPRWDRNIKGALDADGDRIPLLDEHDEITTEKMVKVEEAAYGAYDEKVTYGAHRVADELRRLRDWARAQLKHVLNKLDATDAERKSAFRIMTDAGELAGLHAAAEAIPNRYRASQFEVETLLPLGSRGAGGVDGVFRVTPREGVKNEEGITGPILVVVEAKGPHAELGSRRGPDKRDYQQGRREYLQSVASAMRGSPDVVTQRLGRQIRKALSSGALRYELVRATVDREGSYSGYRHREFDIRRNLPKKIVESSEGNSA